MDARSIERRRVIGTAIAVVLISAGIGFFGHVVFGANVSSSVVVTATAPTMGTVTVNGGNNITLSPGGTVTVPVTAQVNDYNGCADFSSGTTTVALWYSVAGSSTCISGGTPGNENTCYVAAAFTTSTCSGSIANTTTTFNMQYFAKATDASSSVPSSNWRATVIFKAPSGSTTSADSASGTTPDVLTLLAFNLSTSTINYGNVGAGGNTASLDPTVNVQNYGNSTDGSYLYGTAMLNAASSTLSMPTSSQLYATSTFNAGSAGTPLSDVATTQISGFSLTAPTTISIVSSSVYWGLSVPGGTPTGTYNATNTFSALFVSS